GSAKAAVAARSLRRLAPDVAVAARNAELPAGVGVGELADAAVVLGCLDSRHARMTLLARCADAGAPLVDGGTNPWGGEVRLRLSPEESCYGCTLTAQERAENDDAERCGASPYGASIITTTLVAGWMTVAAVRLMLGHEVDWRFLEIATLTGRTQPFAARRDPSCPFHGTPIAAEQVAVGSAATVATLLAALPAGAEPLARGMFPVPGSCYHCGGDYTIDAPAADVIDCPHCGRPVRPDVTQRIRVAPPDATLAAIGVAPAEFISVREPDGGYRWLRLAS
ncbi:ThiF family adenylyltransferase, partial [Dactylosporangium sp. NPDC000244]|uniref:ThiF family adenylyltransferase n=1 Tax=Dactylosporangium sp. NPDC000244 TaxID=3154365 RepID=UPI00332178BA